MEKNEMLMTLLHNVRLDLHQVRSSWRFLELFINNPSCLGTRFFLRKIVNKLQRRNHEKTKKVLNLEYCKILNL